jgi:two-component sensor histidine kinase
LYTNRLAGKLAAEEKKKVALLAECIKTLATAKSDEEITFATNIVTQDSTIPRIITDEQGRVQNYNSIDTSGIKDLKLFLRQKIKEYEAEHAPIVVDYGFGSAVIYYGESYLLSRLRYFPLVQLGIISLFLLVVLIALGTAHRSIQNQVWVGLSKETAHQLGTPISSIEGWMEILREEAPFNEAITEMQKDVDRLKLVADRFGKVGSVPQLSSENLIPRLQEMVNYMQKRAPERVAIVLNTNEQDVMVQISGPIFDWVIENLIRNALDAMEGKGEIRLNVADKGNQVIIDVCDTGKGIPKHQMKKVFDPGFTTKKRGWGLGLSLSRRIIEKYHHGSIFVKWSELKKGTDFRIILNR